MIQSTHAIQRKNVENIGPYLFSQYYTSDQFDCPTYEVKVTAMFILKIIKIVYNL